MAVRKAPMKRAWMVRVSRGEDLAGVAFLHRRQLDDQLGEVAAAVEQVGEGHQQDGEEKAELAEVAEQAGQAFVEHAAGAFGPFRGKSVDVEVPADLRARPAIESSTWCSSWTILLDRAFAGQLLDDALDLVDQQQAEPEAGQQHQGEQQEKRDDGGADGLVAAVPFDQPVHRLVDHRGEHRRPPPARKAGAG